MGVCKWWLSWWLHRYIGQEAMKLIINNPAYRVLKTLSERKAAFLEWPQARN